MDYQDLYKIITKPWITIDEISNMINCSRSSALIIVRKVEEEVLKEGKMLPPSKKKLLPTDKVMKILGIDKETVYENVVKMNN